MQPGYTEKLGSLALFLFHIDMKLEQADLSLYPPQTVFVGGYTVFTLSVRPCIRP